MAEEAGDTSDLPPSVSEATEGPGALYTKGRLNGLYRRVRPRNAWRHTHFPRSSDLTGVLLYCSLVEAQCSQFGKVRIPCSLCCEITCLRTVWVVVNRRTHRFMDLAALLETTR